MTTQNGRRVGLLLAGAVTSLAIAGLTGLAGCSSSSKVQQPLNDAAVTKQLEGPGEVGWGADGFSNWFEKCDDHGHRVFVLFHNDGEYGSVSAIDDPSCPNTHRP